MVLEWLWVTPEQTRQGLPGAHHVCFGALFWTKVVHAHRPARGFNTHICILRFFSSLCTTLPISDTLKTTGTLER